MNRVIAGGLGGLAGGALYGAIGASVGRDADNPVLKGAIVSGLVGGTLSTVAWALIVGQQAEQQLGVGELPSSMGGGLFP